LATSGGQNLGFGSVLGLEIVIFCRPVDWRPVLMPWYQTS